VNLLFRSTPAPPRPLIERVAAGDPTNPFCTLEYVSACEFLGEQPCFIGLCRGEEVVSGCIGFLSGSSLRRSLAIHSLPGIPNPQSFWRGLLDLCRKSKVWRLQIDTYGSPAGEIPQLPGEMMRRGRKEHVLDLEREDVLEGVSSQHRRNISRAVKAGLSVHRTREASACVQHLELMNASLERRAKRGEEVGTIEQRARLLALLRTGSGELFQAMHEGKVLSSILILRSSQGAYYETAGTLPEGMKLGASPFLVARVAAILKQEGSLVFNLGGATDDNPGLQRFKTGFGTREIALEAASFCPKSVVERKFHSALRTGLAWIKQ
jgi:hypothetical protein